jgi:shikimate 5-dehydrogenase
MYRHHNIIIAGAGGIAQAAGLILAELSTVPPSIFIGNRTISKAEQVAKWIKSGTTKPSSVTPFHLTDMDLALEVKDILIKGDILLDCLPGTLAPKMARLAKDFHLHYANLTE